MDKNAPVESLLERQVEGQSRNWHVEFDSLFSMPYERLKMGDGLSVMSLFTA